MKLRGVVNGTLVALLVGTLAMFPGNIAPAQAATSVIVPAPGAPNPVNVLPSMIKGSYVPPIGSSQTAMAALLYKYSKDAAFWTAVKSYQGGTANPAQLATVQASRAAYSVPATKIGGALAKGVNVIGAYQLGLSAGHLVTGVLGIDATGAVCENTRGLEQTFLALASGVDCSAFNELSPDYTPNEDAVQKEAGWARAVYNHSSVSPCAWVVTGSSAGRVGTFTLTTTSNCTSSTTTPLSVNPAARCKNTTSGAIVQPSGTSWSGSGGQVGNGAGTYAYGRPAGASVLNSISCPTGTVLIGLGILDNVGATGAHVISDGLWWRDIPGWPLYLGPQAEKFPDYPQVLGDPLRTLKCVVLGNDGNTYQASTQGYHESDGALPTPNCPDLPEMVFPVEATVWETGNGPDRFMWSEDVTPEFENGTALAPECMDGVCQLDLIKVGGQSCFVGPADCVDWYADPNKGTNYQCRYGTHVVDISECTIYGPAFSPDALRTGDMYADPHSPTQTLPNPNQNAGTDRGTFNNPVQNPSTQRQCMPQGWAVFNPIEWVVRPVQCALEWAFVPRGSVLQNWGNNVRAAWNTTSIRQVVAIAATIPEMVPALGSDCRGPAVVFPSQLSTFGMAGTYYPMSACAEPFSTMASIARIASVAFMGFFGVFAIIRFFAGTIGFVGVGVGDGRSE